MLEKSTNAFPPHTSYLLSILEKFLQQLTRVCQNQKFSFFAQETHAAAT